MGEKLDLFMGLPFVSGAAGGFDLWNVRRTGSWSDDNQIGREYADAVIAVMQKRHMPCLLPHITQKIVNGGEHSGVETGFFHRLAEALTGGSSGSL